MSRNCDPGYKPRPVPQDALRHIYLRFGCSALSIIARIRSASSGVSPRYSMSAVTISSGEPANHRSTIWETFTPSYAFLGLPAEYTNVRPASRWVSQPRSSSRTIMV